MRPFRSLLSFEEAKAVVDRHISAIERTETVAIDDAVNRVLADDFIAAMDVPPFNRAAMDGYAIIAIDTAGASKVTPKILKIAGEVHAGDSKPPRVTTGSVLQISTGAMLPPGADAVIMVEDTERDGKSVKIFKACSPGLNIGRMGEDVKAGTTVLAQGTFLDPGKVGVLASQGLTEVKVYARPRVAVLPTGEEVVPGGKKLKPGQLYDINSHTISTLVTANGGTPVSVGISGDKIEALKATIREALKNDIVVLSGGSSVGTRDLVVDVIEGWGEVLFHGVQIKPGKPTLFAVIEGKPVFGMPGYPTSCLVNGYLFLEPVIRKMAHLPPRPGVTLKAKLSERLVLGIGRRMFYTVKVVNDEAVPVFKESGAITSIAAADGYIDIPANTDLLEKGDPVTVTLF